MKPRPKKLKSKIVLKGSKTKDWVIEISDNYNFKDDIQITHEEMLELKKLINKRV